MPGVPREEGVEAPGRSVVMRRLRSTRFGDGGHDLPRHADAADDLVRRGVADDQPEARDLSAWAQAHAGDRLRANGVGDAAPLPPRDGTSRSRAAERDRGGCETSLQTSVTRSPFRSSRRTIASAFAIVAGSDLLQEAWVAVDKRA